MELYISFVTAAALVPDLIEPFHSCSLLPFNFTPFVGAFEILALFFLHTLSAIYTHPHAHRQRNYYEGRL